VKINLIDMTQQSFMTTKNIQILKADAATIVITLSLRVQLKILLLFENVVIVV